MTWEKVRLKDICTDIIDCVNKTAPINDEPTPYKMLRTSDIRDGYINLDGLNCVTEKVYKQWTRRGNLRVGDVIFTREAPLGEVGLVRSAKNYFLGQRLILLRANKEICDNRFLTYALLFRDNKLAITSRGMGATVLHLRVPECESITISIPPLQVQKRIADILSAYDDLIENHQRQIRLLEEAAQRLYKEWFVKLRFPGHETTNIIDGVPEGWQRCQMQDVISFDPTILLDAKRIKQSVPMSALSTSSMVLDENEFTETVSNSGSHFQNGDTLLARITPCLENGKTGFVWGLQDEMGAVGSTEYIVMRSKKLNPYMIYLLARTYGFRKLAINSMSGADGRQRVNRSYLETAPFICPDKELINRFEKLVKPLFGYIFALNRKCKYLKEARDRLLPRLMRGELKV